MAWRHTWQVLVDGRDVSANMRPYLMSIEVTDKDGMASDSCRLTFDDTGGQCLLPKNGAGVEVRVDGTAIFEGNVDSTPWRLTRSGGRVLEIAAQGFDTRGKAKQPQRWHGDDLTLEEALTRGAEQAGFSIVVDPDLAAIVRDYWSPAGASFLAWGEMIAREIGGTFKLRGKKAALARRGQGRNAAGAPMPVIEGVVGGNVIEVSIDPSKGRPAFARKRVRYFDRETGGYLEEFVEIEAGETPVEAEDVQRWSAADAGQARTMAESQKTDATRAAGVGRVEMDLTLGAQAEGAFMLSGARPGIDGEYRITGVVHRMDRSGGSRTGLDLAQPQGEAGTDSRKT